MDLKKILIILCLVCNTVTADMIGLDYPITDEIIKPVSVGITTWSCDKYGTTIGGFASISCMSFYEKVRLELGAAFKTQDKLKYVPFTGLSVPITDEFILGVWYAPFWNLYQPKTSDDPSGIMIGYRF